MAEISKAVCVYQPGKATDDDLRQKIIQDIVEGGGNFITGFFARSFTEIACINRTKYDTVTRYLVYIAALHFQSTHNNTKGMWAGQQKKVRVVAVQKFGPIPRLSDFRSKSTRIFIFHICVTLDNTSFASPKI